MKNSVEKNVNVLAYYFKANGPKLNGFPKKIEFDGRVIEFIENGLQSLSEQGQRIVQIFEMSDGQSNYKIEFDDEKNDWKLINLIGSV